MERFFSTTYILYNQQANREAQPPGVFAGKPYSSKPLIANVCAVICFRQSLVGRRSCKGSKILPRAAAGVRRPRTCNLLFSRDRNTHQTEGTNPNRTSSRVVSLGKQKHQNCYNDQDYANNEPRLVQLGTLHL